MDRDENQEISDTIETIMENLGAAKVTDPEYYNVEKLARAFLKHSRATGLTVYQLCLIYNDLELYVSYGEF